MVLSAELFPLSGGLPGVVRHPGVQWPSGSLAFSSCAGGEEDMRMDPEEPVQVTSASRSIVWVVPRDIVALDHGLIKVPG